MSCAANSDRAFGPRVNPSCREFDFTLQFEDAILIAVPAASFLLLAIPHAWSLYWRPAQLLRSTNPLSMLKLASLAAIFIFQVTLLVIRTQNDTLQTAAYLAGDVLSSIATVIAGFVSFASHRQSRRPSTILALYLSASILLQAPRVRTLWLMTSASPASAVTTSSLGLVCISLLLESIASKENVSRETPPERSPEVYSGFWNRATFSWLADTFRLGYIKVIAASDLPNLDPKLESKLLHRQLASVWSRYKANGDNPKYALLRACFKAYLPSFLSTAIPRLCVTAFSFSQPLLINNTITFVAQTDSVRDRNYGKGLIGAWALVYFGMAVTNSIYKYQYIRFVRRLKGGLTTLIYQHTVHTRVIDKGDITAVSLMGTDVERVADGARMFNEMWGALLDIAIASWLLGLQLSVACLAPIVLVVVFIGITSKVSASAGSAQRRWIEKVQERLRVTSAALGDMKTVKILGISDIMSNIIQKLRVDEIETSRSFRKIIVATLLLSLSQLNFAPVITFAIYAVISLYWKQGTLLTAQAFTSIALITLLTTPVIVFIQALPTVLQCRGSFDRIEEFCNASDISNNGKSTKLASNTQNKDVELETLRVATTGSPNDQALAMDKASFSWIKDTEPFLKDITIKLQKEGLNAIVGSVGSGKTALLQALLGEMFASSPEAITQLNGAYCSQTPWLENKTILKNIIGVMVYEPKWYEKVKWACGLDADIRLLDKKDETQLGSKGVNLSGGQKQRMALARAVYARQKVVLIDDAFSGIDTNTTVIVLKRLFGPSGILRQQKATIVLTTHNPKIMAIADTITVIEDGRITETGPREELTKGNGYVSKLGLSQLRDFADEVRDDPAPLSSNHTEPQHNASGLEQNDPIEDVRRKNGDASVYRYYAASAGYGTIAANLLSLVVWIFCTEFATVWVKWWSEANDKVPNDRVGMYLGVYALLGVIGVMGACAAGWTAIVSIISNSALQLHSDLLQTALKAPFRYFSTTDNGEILNRFSQDMELIDMSLPTSLVNYTSTAITCLAQVVILAVFSKYLGIAMPFLGIEAKAPLYTSFTEAEAGVMTIRAFGWQSQYMERNYQLIDASQQPDYMLSCVQACLGFVLEIITAIIATVLVALVVNLPDNFSPGSVGVSLVMIVGFSQILVRLIQSWTSLESSIGAVSRVKRFQSETESEEKATDVAPPSEWPFAGAVEIENLTASYGPNMQPALRGVSLSIKAGEHVAICGRSGSGKSSLIMSLAQMIDIERGSKITIDGVEPTTLRRNEFRRRINIIAQDPFFLPGSLRLNIDPFRVVSDEKITKALERVGLWTMAQEKGGLNMDLDPTAWSAGQKQLLCFARAMARDCKILILDEAMSSVDDETESIAQDIIDTEFRKHTVISVVHRLNHINSFDRIALFEEGRLLEFDEPKTLLATPSKFAELYNAGSN